MYELQDCRYARLETCQPLQCVWLVLRASSLKRQKYSLGFMIFIFLFALAEAPRRHSTSIHQKVDEEARNDSGLAASSRKSMPSIIMTGTARRISTTEWRELQDSPPPIRVSHPLVVSEAPLSP